MKKILITLLLMISLVTVAVSFSKEKGSVIKKFVGDSGELHIVVRFADGTIQDNIVDQRTYSTTKEFEFYSTTRK